MTWGIGPGLARRYGSALGLPVGLASAKVGVRIGKSADEFDHVDVVLALFSAELVVDMVTVTKSEAKAWMLPRNRLSWRGRKKDRRIGGVGAAAPSSLPSGGECRPLWLGLAALGMSDSAASERFSHEEPPHRRRRSS